MAPSSNSGYDQKSSTSRTSSKVYEYSPALKDHLQEYDQYKDFLVNGGRSDPSKGQSMGQKMNDWDRIWSNAGGAGKGKDGKAKI